jgi:hypothetical protein
VTRPQRAASTAVVLSLLTASIAGRSAPTVPTSTSTSTSTAATTSTPEVDAKTAEARTEFAAGADAIKGAQWGEGLAAFERSAALRPHALTTYNIAACERALGRYTRARRSFREALQQNEANGGKQLAKSIDDEARGYLAEIEKLLIRLEVELAPADAVISVDGRPLAVDSEGVLVAGLSAPGPGAVVPKAKFTLIADPGAHVVSLSRKGFDDAVVKRTFAAGARDALKLELGKLPAHIHLTSNIDGAAVSISGVDVGVSPVDINRPAGTYVIVVTKVGYDTYRSEVTVRGGEETSFRAALQPESTPITKQWWFWTAAGAAVVGAAVGTYFLTRPEPERPAPDGGGLGWSARLP